MYCLSTNHAEEKVAADFVKTKDIDLILNIIDVHTLKRSLLMSFEIAELGKAFTIIYNQKGGRNYEKFIKKIHETLPFSHKVFDVEKILQNEHDFFAHIKESIHHSKNHENYILDHIYKEEKQDILKLKKDEESLEGGVSKYLEKHPNIPHMFFEKRRLETLKNIF